MHGQVSGWTIRAAHRATSLQCCWVRFSLSAKISGVAQDLAEHVPRVDREGPQQLAGERLADEPAGPEVAEHAERVQQDGQDDEGQEDLDEQTDGGADQQERQEAQADDQGVGAEAAGEGLAVVVLTVELLGELPVAVVVAEVAAGQSQQGDLDGPAEGGFELVLGDLLVGQGARGDQVDGDADDPQQEQQHEAGEAGGEQGVEAEVRGDGEPDDAGDDAEGDGGPLDRTGRSGEVGRRLVERLTLAGNAGAGATVRVVGGLSHVTLLRARVGCDGCRG